MARQSESDAVTDAGQRTGRDPIVLAAAGSVLLAWYQYYVRGNRHHGLFIGLWPPTLLAFSNTVRIRRLNRKVESKTANLFERLTQSR